MAESRSPRIDPSALISPEAELGADVQVSAFCTLEGKVRVGRGCVLGARACLVGPLTLGENNRVYLSVVLGERPQHLRYNEEPTGLDIGSGNTFREHVTVHRGTTESWRTRVGNHNHFMAGSHIAHDCQVGNHCTLAVNALLGGHCRIGDGAYVGGNSCVHQFCRIGRLAVLDGASVTTKDIPPFIVQQGINGVVGFNRLGMRRAGLNSSQIEAMGQVYGIVYLRGLTLPNALAMAELELGSVDVVREFVDFVRQSRRGINGIRGQGARPARRLKVDLREVVPCG
jgi:UDP-N-acetylglucosamine acyltransferase